jgi:class 3 adenylate cyclase/tetratricopeptide (TPR) repeat protein
MIDETPSETAVPSDKPDDARRQASSREVDDVTILDDDKDEAALGELEHVEMDESRGGQRPVSIIFASISGFGTNPSMTQDEMEEVAVRKSGFDAALDEVISRYGGSIDKIIRGFFMATFGTQRSTKDDPVFAVLSAIEMTEIAGRFNAEVHVGVNSGKAWVGQIRTERTIDTTVIGDTVNLAARLKTKAGHNEVVVSPATHALTEDFFEYEPLPPVTVKGISQPVPIWAVRGKKEAANQIQATREDDVQRLARLQEAIPEYLRAKIASGQNRLSGERKMVTMLFSDVSGFTALSEKFKTQPELIAEVMNRCHKRLGDVIYRYEGVIDKIVGDELMAMFGAPVIHEDDPERAIWCAIEMMDEMAKFSEEVQAEFGVPPLTVHIGINTGRVSIGNIAPGSARMDYTVIGEPVELAEILEDVSEGGEIIVGERTYRLTRALIDFKELPAVELGGKMVPIYLVIGKKDVTESKRGLSAILGDVPMVGRETQYAQMMSCLDRLFNAESPIATIIGEAGFGKSRLKRETRRVLEERGGLWIEGACFPNTVNSSYSVFVRAFEDYFGLKENDAVDVRRTKLEAKLTEVLENDLAQRDDLLPYLGNMLTIRFEGSLGERIAFLDPEQLQRRTWVAVRDLLAYLAKKQPVVLALDDLHWLDNVSNDLIYFLLDGIRDVPVFFVLIYRPERRDLCWAIGETAETKYAARYTRVEIAPLTLDASRMLLDIMLPSRDKPEMLELKSTLLLKAGGNPFYLEEFIRVLVDDNFIVRDGDVWRLIKDVSDFRPPDSLEQMLSARIDKLDDASKAVLQTASVIGRQFEHKTLTNVVDDANDLDSCLAYLTDLNFVKTQVPDPLIYEFGHIVTYEISYNAIVVGQRRELHRRVGDTIEKDHEDALERYVELLAFHFVQSSNRHKAVRYCARAGSKSRRLFNNRDAVTSYEQGLQFAEQLPDVDPNDLQEILEGLGDVYTVLGRYDDALKVISRALDGATQPLHRAMLCRKLGLVYQRRADWENATANLNRALETLEEMSAVTESVVEKARLFDLKGFVSYARGNFADAKENCDKALELALTTDALDVLCSVFKNLGSISLRMGRFDEAMSYYAKGIELAERVGDKLLMSQLYNNMSAAHKLQAKTDAAIEAIQRSIELKEGMGYADGLTRSYASLGSLLRQRGDMETARAYYERALSIAEEIGSPQGIAEAETLIGAFLWYLREYDEAIRHYERGLQTSRSIGDRQNEVAALLNISDAYISKNDLESADRFAREAETAAREIGMKQTIAKAQVNLGTIYWKQRRYEDALTEFGNALESSAEARDVAGQAEIYRNMGDLYTERGDNDRARENLTKAADIYEKLGSAKRAEEIRARIPT